jgi:lipoprotein-anchoring transpeptidase ErfK/SrfK
VETIKTAIVVVVLLGILYGVYLVLNKPSEVPPPPEAAWQAENAAPPQVQLGEPTTLGSLASAPPVGPAGPADQPLPKEAPALDQQRASDATLATATDPRDTAAPSRLPVQEAIAQLDGTQARLATANVADSGKELVATPVVGLRGRAGTADPRDSVSGSAKNLKINDGGELPARRAFDSAWCSAIAQMQKQDWTGALMTLSLFYNDPELSGEERQRLVDLLDPLAGKVIYSSEHTLARPHVVRPGETLDEVAQRYQVPVALLQNINGIVDPRSLQPGAKLKVIPGPFRAEIDLPKSELAIFVGKYYAGRFPVSIGNAPPPKPGEYEVLAKQEGRDYQAANGARIPARAPDNPYGYAWIDLGDNLSIHGSPESISSQGSTGCISLTAADAADVFGILTQGSKVGIR